MGIKTFGIASGEQKIAQFKANHNEWSEIINQIKNNSKGKTKDEIDSVNRDLYCRLALNIAELRNKRIASSEAQLQGFTVSLETENVQAVYHVLMPSKKGEKPAIYVGETPYNRIDLKNIKVTGCTSDKNPTNFDFTDGKHRYRFTAADSQLLMDFENKKIIKEEWEVVYAEDAYSIFSGLADKVVAKEKQSILGEWILKKVFQLEDYEPLTRKRLNEIGINALRLYKISGSDDIHIEFIWINKDNKPNDFFC